MKKLRYPYLMEFKTLILLSIFNGYGVPPPSMFLEDLLCWICGEDFNDTGQ